MTNPSPFHQWLHSLPATHVQALRDFRRCARAAHPDDPAYLATAFDAGNLAALLRPTADPRKAMTHHEAAAVISAMPRDFVVAIGI
jgi:hypothetical protein